MLYARRHHAMPCLFLDGDYAARAEQYAEHAAQLEAGARSAGAPTAEASGRRAAELAGARAEITAMRDAATLDYATPARRRTSRAQRGREVPHQRAGLATRRRRFHVSPSHRFNVASSEAKARPR